MKKYNYIGTDIGGTTFTSALYDHERNQILKSKKEYISNYSSTLNLINGISNQINDITQNNLIAGIGLSCPGPLNSKKGLILHTPNLKFLRNCNIKNEIERRLNIPCKIENDANLFALGENFHYDIRDKVYLGITLGTGLGFGIVINGKLFTGGNGMAAEYGISPFNNSNWESFCSINWIENQVKDILGLNIDPERLNILATNGDVKAIKIWNKFGENLGMCLTHVVNMIDPNFISIGGGLSSAFILFKHSLEKILSTNCPSYNEHNIQIMESRLKEDAAMLGATLLFND